VSLRVAFMGTPPFAAQVLEAVLAAGHTIASVHTRPPAAAGRGMKSKASAVDAMATERGLPVSRPGSLRDGAVVEAFRAAAPDVAIVVAYGLLLPESILAVPPHGCLNVHASLLPRWRGAAPIERAIMAGDCETGVCLMQMERGLDTGPVGLVDRVAINSDDDAGALHDRLAAAGAAIAVRGLAELEAGRLAFTPQPDLGVTYAAKIAAADRRIDWTRPAPAIHDQVRALAPRPGAFFEADLGRGPEQVRLLRSGPTAALGQASPGTLVSPDTISCGEGALRTILLQRAGGSPVPAEEFWRGARLAPGMRVG
jgi:methionyl-tRNA formyltransferase